jgi:hypothetical protein
MAMIHKWSFHENVPARTTSVFLRNQHILKLSVGQAILTFTRDHRISIGIPTIPLAFLTAKLVGVCRPRFYPRQSRTLPKAGGFFLA